MFAYMCEAVYHFFVGCNLSLPVDVVPRSPRRAGPLPRAFTARSLNESDSALRTLLRLCLIRSEYPNKLHCNCTASSGRRWNCSGQVTCRCARTGGGLLDLSISPLQDVVSPYPLNHVPYLIANVSFRRICSGVLSLLPQVVPNASQGGGFVGCRCTLECGGRSHDHR